MSRAFVKEDRDEPERSGRRRSASGLPAGAANYMTARGAEHIRKEVEQARADGDGAALERWEHALASAVVIEDAKETPEVVTFGTAVTIQLPDQSNRTFRIVGVDELPFHEDAVSWVSPIAKASVGEAIGARISVPEENLKGTITRIASLC